ncbi:homoserine dehydrogenase [Kitasatospora sp. NPDC089797]|uniref:homoserine dehydrogenase n=1 Tax=Kitasatospora sp. NPDC089797 TaxID=3155298 RepID=UPI003440C93A
MPSPDVRSAPRAGSGPLSPGAAGPAVVLSGYGPVGRAYAERLLTRAAGTAPEDEVRPRLAAVRVRSAEALLHDGGPVPPRAQWGPSAPLAGTLDRTGAQVLVQALPSSPEAREQAAAEAVLALSRGVHVVTATKSHLLSHWSELRDAARAGGSLIRISGATGAALPAADLARTGVRGLGCRSIRACPNGTATFVLDRLAAGDPLDAAVREAQHRGIAEADPSADLSGADAATKVRLLAALLWGWEPSAVRIATEPVDEAAGRAARAAAAQGHRLRAVASASADRPLVVEVRLERTAPGDPLHALTGPEKAVVYGCPEAGDITVSGGRSSPLGAALALLRDTLDVTAGRSFGFA